MALEVGNVVSAGASVNAAGLQLQPQPPVFGRVINIDVAEVTVLWADGRLVVIPLGNVGDPSGIDIIKNVELTEFSDFIGRTVQVGRFDNDDNLISGSPGFIGVITMAYSRTRLGRREDEFLVLTPDGLWFEVGFRNLVILPDR